MKTIKAYKIKHIPTGLYYQPAIRGNNLSKTGKVYQTCINPLTMYAGCTYMDITLNINSQVYKKYKDYFPELKECKSYSSILGGHITKDKFEFEYLK